jgi:hypothetical protein
MMGKRDYPVFLSSLHFFVILRLPEFFPARRKRELKIGVKLSKNLLWRSADGAVQTVQAKVGSNGR